MSSYSDLILAHGSLVVYYRLGDASGDFIDAGPNTWPAGSVGSGGVTHSVADAIANDADTAVTFDGSGDGKTATDANFLDLADAFSIEFWFKRSATQGTNQTVVNKGSTAYQVRFDTANRLALLKTGTAGDVARTNAITDQNYHHAVITKDGANGGKVYIDGVDATTAGANQTFADSAAVLRIGSAGVASNRLSATLDELALYNAPLTAAQVRQHYDTGIGERRETDSVSVSDTQALEVATTPSDTVAASDSAAVDVTTQQADSVSASDQASVEPGRAEADSVSVSDALTTDDGAVLGDSVSASDSTAMEVQTTQADSVIASESLNTELYTDVSLSDSVTASDAQALTVEVALSDSVTANDAVVTDWPVVAPTHGGGWAMPRKRPLVQNHQLVLADVALLGDEHEVTHVRPPQYHHAQRVEDRVMLRDDFVAKAELNPRSQREEELVLALI